MSSRRRAGLSLRGDQTAQKGRGSVASGRKITPGKFTPVVASLVSVNPLPRATSCISVSRETGQRSTLG